MVCNGLPACTRSLHPAVAGEAGKSPDLRPGCGLLSLITHNAGRVETLEMDYRAIPGPWLVVEGRETVREVAEPGG